ARSAHRSARARICLSGRRRVRGAAAGAKRCLSMIPAADGRSAAARFRRPAIAPGYPPPNMIGVPRRGTEMGETAMTPQERQLVDELFDRLAQLENAPRDPDADRAIADGLRQAPHAVYALVQTALVQDEALKRANARIQELEGGQPEEPRRG